MRFAVVVIGALALAGCGQQQTPQEKAADAAQDVASVKQVNRAAIKPIVPQLILYPDIADNHLEGSGCAFAAGKEVGAVLLTRSGRAYMKLDDKVLPFLADMGSPKLAAHTHTDYRGNNLLPTLTADMSATGKSHPGHLVVHDLDGNLVYDERGIVQCS